MKSSLKIAFVVFVSFIVLACGAIFMASKKLKPEELRKIFITQVETALPNSIVKTNSIDFSLGLTSIVTINGIDITLKSPKQFPLVKLDKLKLEIPFWSILFGGGKIEFIVNGPKINYIEFQDSSNWQFAAGEKKKETIKNESSAKLVIPAFLANSEINIKLENIDIEYALKDKSKGELNIEKFLFKDIGIKSTTVFELKSKMNILQNTPNQTSLELLVIGETNLSDYIADNKISLKSQIILSNIINKNLKNNINKIAINSLTSLSSSVVNSKTSIVFEEKDLLSTTLDYQNSNLKISELSANINMKDILTHVVDISTLPISLSGNEVINIQGSADIGKTISPNFKVKTTSPLRINMDDIKADMSLVIDINSRNVSLNSEVQAFSGKVISNARMPIDWNNINMKTLETLSLDVMVRDLKIPKEKLIFKTSPKKSVEVSGDKKEVKQSTPVFLPIPLNSKITFSNVLIAESKIEGALKLIATSKGLIVSSENLTIDKGEITLNSTVIYKANKLKTNIQSSLKNIDLNAISPFLPKDMLDSLSGLASGSLTLDTLGDDYIAKVDAVLADGKLSKINLKSYVDGLLDKLGKFKDKIGDEKLKLDGEFKTLSFKGVFDNKKHYIQNSYFLDKGQKASITGVGSIYPLGPQESSLDIKVKIIDPKLATKLKTEIGSDSFPIKLSGSGYELKADYTHTLKAVANEAVKVQGKKKLDEILKKTDTKKLLKGLFK